MRLGLLLLAQILALPLVAPLAHAADETMHIELNAAENTENRCRLTFVIENKGKSAIESFKLDLALFNAEGTVYRRMLVDMAPVRAAKTIVKTFITDGDCGQLGSVLVNEITACQPGEPAACQDTLALSSRVKTVKFFNKPVPQRQPTSFVGQGAITVSAASVASPLLAPLTAIHGDEI